MNKKLFGNNSGNVAANKIMTSAGLPNTVNNAGGQAYSRTSEGELAQLVVTGTFNNTFYVTGENQAERIKKLANECSPEFVAKCAIYGHKVAHMKDTPAMLLALLAGRNESKLVEKIFPQVITNQKMLRNFVQVIRSGTAGRKSFGSAIKRAIQTWLTKQKSDNLFKGAVGNDPSLADVVKMVHPHPESPEKQAFYGWLLNKKYDGEALPAQVKIFEDFKKGGTEIPDADFRMLTPFLTDESWKKVALNMPWNALRMNLNTFARHNVFQDANVVSVINAKLQDREAVKRSNAFPYQILTTTQAIRGGLTPAPIYLALEQAMEYATENVPVFNTNGVAVCVDTSGSMGNPATGNREGSTTVTKCVDVAALMASCVLRKNPDKTLIVPFDTRVHTCNFNPYDSVMKNAATLARFGGGGTDCASALYHLNSINYKGDTVIFVSDNESWYRGSRSSGWSYGGRGDFVSEWASYKKRNPKAKLVCIDITPNNTTQAPDMPSEILNVGGFSDSVFEVVANFINNDNRNFAQVINDAINL